MYTWSVEASSEELVEKIKWVMGDETYSRWKFKVKNVAKDEFRFVLAHEPYHSKDPLYQPPSLKGTICASGSGCLMTAKEGFAWHNVSSLCMILVTLVMPLLLFGLQSCTPFFQPRFGKTDFWVAMPMLILGFILLMIYLVSYRIRKRSKQSLEIIELAIKR